MTWGHMGQGDILSDPPPHSLECGRGRQLHLKGKWSFSSCPPACLHPKVNTQHSRGEQLAGCRGFTSSPFKCKQRQMLAFKTGAGAWSLASELTV